MRASKGHIQSHIRVALDLGLSKEEILEAIEIRCPRLGSWPSRRASKPGGRLPGRRIEPSTQVHQGGSGSR